MVQNREFDENTPTPTTIRQKANMADLRYPGDKEALIHGARNLWGTHSESEVLGYLHSKDFKPAGRIAGGCDSTDGGSLLLGVHEDMDLSSLGGHGGDVHRTSDEKLLAMLGDMARGSPEDDNDIQSDVLSLSLLPLEVQEDDPHTRALVDECGTAWEEVYMEAEAKREMQSRLRRELRQLQERSERQYQESAVFMQRLASAREALADKIKEASFENQDLRGRISVQWRDNERLSCTISEGVKSLAARAAELSAEIWEVSDSQATLVEQLKAAMDTQTRLQAELQEERVKTWRQSTDVVMAFAMGSSSASWHSKDDSLSSCKGEPSSGVRAHLERQAQQVVALNKELSQEDAERCLLESQLDEAKRRLAACGVTRLQSQPVPAATSSEESSEAEDELSEAADSKPKQHEKHADFIPYTDEHLANFADGQDVSYETLMDYLQEVEELRAELEMKEGECRSAREQFCQAEERLLCEQDELSAYHHEMVEAQARDEDSKHQVGQATDLVSVLCGEIQSEQAVLSLEQQSAGRRREVFRSQVEQKRQELRRMQELNDRLMDDLNSQGSGCFFGGKRAPPPPSSRGRQPQGSSKGYGKGQQGMKTHASQGAPMVRRTYSGEHQPTIPP
eukprot:TRINITY_DN11622_c0_g1_i3.p1 TRINITY_DN11622_c0_g1~~TRINITY_DN11622_c0_g1_i3.p1  ORF type:complete len:635 (+),score=156.84 TRINITY_DN11622_c0_g1_i3:37-1905(+)